MTGVVLCIGHAVQDFIFTVPEIPSAPVKHRASKFDTIGGGPAATAAVAIARLGGSATLATRLGDDAIGASIIAELESEGVDCSHAKRFAGCASALSAVMIDAHGDRQIVNHTDATVPKDARWITAASLDGVSALLADITWPEGAHAGLALAREKGVPGILDADHPIPSNRAAFEAASHVAFSAQGLRAFTHEENLRTALSNAARDIGGWCCVTDGPDGVLMTASDDPTGITHCEGFKVDAIDTLGAGDVWHGAFALGLAEKMDAYEAVRFANAAAALKVTKPGGRRGAPTRSETDAFLQSCTKIQAAEIA